MNRHERAAFLRSDEDDPDYLRDKPMGRCPWCGRRVREMRGSTLGLVSVHEFKLDKPDCEWWDNFQSELENRARYQEERMAAAKIEERSP